MHSRLTGRAMGEYLSHNLGGKLLKEGDRAFQPGAAPEIANLDRR
jgi:hypothetical protein